MALSKPTATVVALVLLPLIAAPVLIGDVNPPPGPVTGTMKPLSQVEPRTPVETLPSGPSATRVISQAGSYYLTGNLSLTGGSLAGIEIATSGVTLDLSGFALTGSGTGAAGILVSGVNRSNLVIRNGTISGWNNGINGSNAVNSQVEGICVSSGGNGIVMGNNCSVRDCTARTNGLTGISVGLSSLVTHCTSSGNFVDGITLSNYGLVNQCTAHDNFGRGFVATEGSAVIECTSTFNDLSGIEVTTNTMVLHNTCMGNGTSAHANIYVLGNRNRIEGNQVSNSVRGIELDIGGNLVIQNSVSSAATAYDIVGTQTIGPILVGGGTIASTNPWANFEF